MRIQWPCDSDISGYPVKTSRTKYYFVRNGCAQAETITSICNHRTRNAFTSFFPNFQAWSLRRLFFFVAPARKSSVFLFKKKKGKKAAKENDLGISWKREISWKRIPRSHRFRFCFLDNKKSNYLRDLFFRVLIGAFIFNFWNHGFIPEGTFLRTPDYIYARQEKSRYFVSLQVWGG